MGHIHYFLIVLGLLFSVIDGQLTGFPRPIPPIFGLNPCQQRPAVRGFCNRNQERYTYYPSTRRCERFTYGGCFGNQNNFRSEAECRRQCIEGGEGGLIPPIGPPIIRPPIMDPCTQRHAQRGPCRARIQRYTYNPDTGRCETFMFGGCLGNMNNFRTESECRDRCERGGGEPIPPPGPVPPVEPSDRCNDRHAVRGPCRARIQRYTYNPTTQKCESFTYGGCRGNRNSFRTRRACEDQCEQTGTGGRNPCRERYAVAGNCFAFMPMYTYNFDRRRCERFIYGGCGGNNNRFPTMRECQQRCRAEPVPQPPIDPNDPCSDRHAVQGPCGMNQERFTYNPDTKKCESFRYGGCRGNRNNFRSRKACEDRCEQTGGGGETDPCKQEPAVVGRCRAAMPRFTYNPVTGNCERFIYGGCGGNQNNFRRLRECQRRCVDAGSRDPCEERYAVSGPCFANMPMYTYNFDTRRCERFTYGGCGGNRNRFGTRRECQLQCSERGINGRCLLPMRRGPCIQNERRFYYNTETRRCEEFIYSGCFGNSNNFRRMRDCQRACQPRRPLARATDTTPP